MISTLQRMYRHFYFRLCDIVDTAGLSEAGGIDLREIAIFGDSCGHLGGGRDLSRNCVRLREDSTAARDLICRSLC